MGTTTAGLPLTGRWAGAHYERCPVASCGTVFRSKRRTRFRCPACHTLTYAVPTPAGEPGDRRAIEGDAQGRVFRVIPRRPGEGETAPTYGDDVVLFLESPDGAGVADPAPSPAPGGPAPTPPTPTDRRAAGERERGTGLIGRLWRGSLSDLRR